MRSTALTCALACLLAAPAAADVTITGTTTGKAMIVNVGGTTVTRIKGNRMRVDMLKDGKESSSVIYDIDQQRYVTLDPGKKEAEITSLAKLQEVMTKVTAGEVKSRITPTGETKTVAGMSCKMHDLQVEVPFDMSGKGEMPATFVMTGPACLAKDVPGHAEYAKFYATAVDKGFIFGSPRGVQGPGAATQRGLAAFHRSMAEAGFPVDSTINAKMSGEGPMAMMGKMFTMNITQQISKVETEAIPDSAFEVPAGYKVKQNN